MHISEILVQRKQKRGVCEEVSEDIHTSLCNNSLGCLGTLSRTWKERRGVRKDFEVL